MDTAEDSDDSSSVDALEKFREQWQQELETTSGKVKYKAKNTTQDDDSADDENKVCLFFRIAASS